MSNTTASVALDRTDVRNGGDHHRSLFAGVLQALADAHAARAEYQRQVARGVDPSAAVRTVFEKVDG